jgi:hypothetical protein
MNENLPRNRRLWKNAIRPRNATAPKPATTPIRIDKKKNVNGKKWGLCHILPAIANLLLQKLGDSKKLDDWPKIPMSDIITEIFKKINRLDTVFLKKKSCILTMRVLVFSGFSDQNGLQD